MLAAEVTGQGDGAPLLSEDVRRQDATTPWSVEEAFLISFLLIQG